MKIALGFWGITRSLKYTIQSIQQFIINPLRRHNIEIVIYMHTFSINSKYNNIRTGEMNIQLDNEEYKLLKPNHIRIDDQDIIKSKICIHEYRTQPDPWKTNYNSVDNFICAMYSKNQVVNMIEKSQQQFDYIMFLRPDVKYLHPFPIEYLKHVRNNTICIPNFAKFYNFNDRFAITNMNTYKLYGALFDELMEYSKTGMLHSEKYQQTQLTKRNIRLVYIPFFFNRIRFTGTEVIDVIQKTTKKPIQNTIQKQNIHFSTKNESQLRKRASMMMMMR